MIGYSLISLASIAFQYGTVSSRLPEQYLIPRAQVETALGSANEADFVSMLGVPHSVKVTAGTRSYVYVSNFSVQRNYGNLKENGGFSIIAISVKFRDSKRVSCRITQYLYVGNDLELGPLEAARKGVRIRSERCSDRK